MHMNKNRGSVMIGFGVILGLLALIAAFGVMSYVSAYNYGNEAEKGLSAKLNDNKNVLGQYTIKIGEMAQVTDMQRDDLREIIQATFEGRYGEDGSAATWQWIKEQNPTLDPAVYNRLQQTMEAGRNEFKVSQTELLDAKRAYETNLGYLWKGTWLRIAGYPTINLDDIKIVVAGNTEQVFEDGVDPGVKLRN